MALRHKVAKFRLKNLGTLGKVHNPSQCKAFLLPVLEEVSYLHVGVGKSFLSLIHQNRLLCPSVPYKYLVGGGVQVKRVEKVQLKACLYQFKDPQIFVHLFYCVFEDVCIVVESGSMIHLLDSH